MTGSFSQPELERLRRRLRVWYRAEQRSLPWRKTTDPYAIWVAETMLQQTRVETVIRYYRRFLTRFPTIEALARSRESSVLAVWSGLGYYRRARSLHRAAREVVDRHAGRLPRSAGALTRLPGIGPYTAAAVSSIAFGKAEPVVDGNVARVLTRLFGIRTVGAAHPGSELPWKLARQLLPARRPGEWNQALMELGATVCTPKRPCCDQCPVRRSCRAFRAGEVDRIPGRRSRPATIRRRRAVAVVERRGAVLVQRNEEGGLLKGLWEFPGVEVPSRRDPRRTLRQTLRGIGVRGGRLVHRETIRHSITRYRIDTEVYELVGDGVASAAAGPESSPARWVTPSHLERLPFSSVGLRIRDHLRRRGRHRSP